MIQKIKNKITENSGLVNMAINLAILYLLFTVATGIKSLSDKVTRVEQQTSGTLQPVMGMKPANEEELRRMILDMVIAKLQEARNEEIKR